MTPASSRFVGRPSRQDADSGRLPFLDGVRGVAIGLVVTYDYLADFYHPTVHSNPVLIYLDHLFAAGWAGVDLFFVLSGFLICGILLDHRDAQNYYRTFYVRRAYRILPLYAVVLSPVFVAPLLEQWRPGLSNYVSSGDIKPVWHLFFVQNVAMAVLGSFGERWIATTWSLAVEEQFYALAPVFVRRFRLRMAIWISVAFIVGVPILRTTLLVGLPRFHAVVICYVLLRWDALVLGVLAAYIIRQPDWVSALKRNEKIARRAVAGLGAVTFAAVNYSPEPGSFLMSSVGHTILSLFFAATLVYCLLFRNWLVRLLELKVLCWLGMVSYGVYLFHEPVVSAVFEIVFGRRRNIASLADVGLASLALAVTLALAAVSRRYFEGPFIMLGHRHQYEPKIHPLR